MKEFKQWLLSILIAGSITIGAVDIRSTVIAKKYDPMNHPVDAVQLVNDNKALPTRLIIPSIIVNSQIDYVGNDAEGRMDVPSNIDNVGWYQEGPIPGEVGQSVIAGHLDSANGPAVFSKLSSLRTGDIVEVVNDLGNTLKFKVYKTEVYKDAVFPIDKVFGQTDFAGLNLITCTGTFDRSQKNYSDRLVVYTKLSQ